MAAVIERRKARILCVDDEPAILRSLRWLLQKDFEVEVAESGYDGLTLVRQHDFDVVISDQRMPGMVGSDFLREVSRVSPRSMRILLTGYSDLQSILKSVNESEVFRFVSKPWKFQELVKVVDEAATIARQAPAAPPRPVQEAATIETGGGAVLVVDDDPATRELVAQVVGTASAVLGARDLAEAVAALEAPQPVGIIVCNMRVGNIDATRLVKLLKHEYPDIVTLVYTGEADAVDVISLINQAQVFRVLPKPVRPTTLRLALTAATLKRRQLRDNPALARRHAVEAVDASERETLARDVERQAQAVATGDTGAASFLRRLGGGLRRLLGRR